MIKYVQSATDINELVAEHRRNNGVIAASKLEFTGVDGCDVYNISQQFSYGGKEYIAGRVERRNSEISRVVLFERVGDILYKATEVAFDMLQDPCQCVVDGELILGGTAIYTDRAGAINNWNTTFFRGTDVNCLRRFADAPAKMKDVRMIKTDRIHVFTRPQGGVARYGKIGYVACDNLEEITPELMSGAQLLTTQFDGDAWGGVNEVHALKGGKLGVVGHIAKMSQGMVRHYYGMVFCFDPITKQSSKVKIICERADFAAGEYKRPDLIDVVFCGGLVRNNDNTATVYVGLSDAEAHRAIIRDPFAEYEEQ